VLLLPNLKKSLPLKNYRKALGCDPGKENFGWAIYIRGLGLTHSSVTDGIDKVTDISFFRKNIVTILNTHQPDCVCIERFHSQPRRGSKKNLELVNLAIGVAVEVFLSCGLPVDLVTAATHKSWLSRNFEVGFREETTRGKIKRKYDITTYKEWQHLNTEHEADAANMAKYAVEHVFNQE